MIGRLQANARNYDSLATVAAETCIEVVTGYDTCTLMIPVHTRAETDTLMIISRAPPHSPPLPTSTRARDRASCHHTNYATHHTRAIFG